MAAARKKRNRTTGIRSIRRAIWQGILLVCFGALLAGGFNAVRTTGLTWKGTWSSASLAASRLQGLEEIPLDKAWSLYQTGKALFLDARDRATFDEGHIKGALHSPPGETESYREEIRVLALSGLVIIAYCDGVDCPLSTELARSLQQAGIPSVRVLVDGWSRWSRAGYPTEKRGG
jgi:rhodanese-related sulfurtransferase